MKTITTSVLYVSFFFLSFNHLVVAQGSTDASLIEHKYHRVKIYTDRLGIQKLSGMGVAFDHGEVKQDVYYISDFADRDVEIIKKSGLKYEILIKDVSTYYAQRNAQPHQPKMVAAVNCNHSVIKTPNHFRLGSYAGFYKYDELLAILDSMQLLYPNLISKKESIDTSKTWEGRPVYWLRISNKPNVDQPNKPELFYSSLIHAREPLSLMETIYYMWYLLDNYNNDPEVKGIVDNTEMYFVPCVNPDGYVYNQTTNPTGGGMQRKNMRTNSGGSKGVDLNRNFDLYWGYDNMGSSDDASADNYRGPGVASEPETKMIKKFCLSHEFRYALNCHSYSKLLIHAWGYKADYFTPDSLRFTAYGKFLTEENQYKVGTPSQTVGYIGNGATTDWFYGASGLKNKIYEYSPEAGDDFYPAINDIIPTCKEMFYTNYKLAKLALKYVTALDREPYYISSLTGSFNYEYKSMVPDSMAKFSISIIPLSSDITSVGNAKNYTNTAVNSSLNDSISFVLNSSIKQGTTLKYVIKITNGVFSHSDTVTKMYGNPLIAFADNGNSINQWITSTGWGVSDKVYHSPAYSISDSPLGNYADNATTNSSTKSSIDLTNASHAMLSFWAKWDIELGFDYVQLLASSDSGQTWIPLCGKYTSTGNDKQDKGNPIYDATHDWVREEVSLLDFVGKKVWLRFALQSDNKNTFDGFYFDDLKVEKLTGSINAAAENNNSIPHLSICMPNPAQDYTYINYEMVNHNSASAKIIVINSIGQVMHTQPLTQLKGNIQLSTQNLPNGIYHYFLQAGGVSSPACKLSVVH
jgi:carboxypeptidase T